MKKVKNQLNIFDEKPRPKTPETSFKVVSIEKNLNREKHQAIYQKFLSLSNHLDK